MNACSSFLNVFNLILRFISLQKEIEILLEDEKLTEDLLMKAIAEIKSPYLRSQTKQIAIVNVKFLLEADKNI